MSWLGSMAIYFALYVSIVAVALGAVAAITRSRRFLHAARFACYAVAGSLTAASAILIHAFLTHDFSIQYVASFSDTTMPTFYLLGAFWGGQAGSLLFWIWKAAAFSALCVYVNRKKYQQFMPWVMATCMAVVAGLMIILVFGSNPFDPYHIIDDPSDGEGLNPLLQTPKMILHPPFLLSGMATMTVPFAFAIAALLSGNLGNTWVEAARKWILIPWLLLTIGNILGGMWAYEELGWGGYWAWDPVENASLLPWLTSTALIHSLLIQERRGMLKRWNVGLMIGTFLLTIFGTYITRSGLIESIHSFAQSSIGPYFLTLLITLTVSSLALFIWRWKDLRAEQRLDSPVSREAAFIFNNWMFLSMTTVVLYGTLWPRIREWFSGQDVAMGPQWFNQWMIPLGLLMLAMMGVGTIIAWRRASWRNFKRNFVVPIVATVILTPIVLAAYWFGRGADLGVTPDEITTAYAVTAVGLCFFVTATIVQEFYRGMSARRRGHDETWMQSFVRLCMKQKRRYGGYIVHLGVVFAFLAFAGNALKIEKDVSLQVGESVTVGDYTLTHHGLHTDDVRSHRMVISTMTVERGGEPFYDFTDLVAYNFDRLRYSFSDQQPEPIQPYTSYPGKAFFHATMEMPISEIDIRSTPMEDLYVALVNFDPNTETAVFKVFVSPFTWFFWFGGAILVLGALICLWPTRRALNTLQPGRGGWGRAAIFGSLVALCFAPVIIWTAESHTEWGNAQRYERIVAHNHDPGPHSPPDITGPETLTPEHEGTS